MAKEKTTEMKVEVKKGDYVFTWIVTEFAGPKVNGKRVKKGDEIKLTEDQARSEEILGTIKKKNPQKKAAKTEDE